MRTLLNAMQVSQILGISLDRTYSLAREGYLPSVRLKKTIRFCSDELECFIKQGGKGLDNNT